MNKTRSKAKAKPPAPGPAPAVPAVGSGGDDVGKPPKKKKKKFKKLPTYSSSSSDGGDDFFAASRAVIRQNLDPGRIRSVMVEQEKALAKEAEQAKKSEAKKSIPSSRGRMLSDADLLIGVDGLDDKELDLTKLPEMDSDNDRLQEWIRDLPDVPLEYSMNGPGRGGGSGTIPKIECEILIVDSNQSSAASGQYHDCIASDAVATEIISLAETDLDYDPLDITFKMDEQFSLKVQTSPVDYEPIEMDPTATFMTVFDDLRRILRVGPDEDLHLAVCGTGGGSGLTGAAAGEDYEREIDLEVDTPHSLNIGNCDLVKRVHPIQAQRHSKRSQTARKIKLNLVDWNFRKKGALQIRISPTATVQEVIDAYRAEKTAEMFQSHNPDAQSALECETIVVKFDDDPLDPSARLNELQIEDGDQLDIVIKD